MDPINVYREVVPRGLRFQHRLFSLFQDRIDVASKWGSAVTQLSIPLTELRTTAPLRSKLRMRIYKRTSLASVLLLLAVFGLLLIRSSMVQWVTPGSPEDRVLLGVVWALAILLSLVILVTVKYRNPVEVAKFLNIDGKVALDMLQLGPDAKRFDEFVRQVLKQIRAAQRSNASE